MRSGRADDSAGGVGGAVPGQSRLTGVVPGQGRRSRLPADDRRRQLVGIGLRMLTERPIHELSVDKVASAAGISRGLLFHYFPTKRDFYVAVVRAAARRLLRACEPDPEATPERQLAQMLDGYVRFLERRRDPYVALFRGTVGGADYVRQIYEDTREVFTFRALSALGLDDPPPLVALAVRGWFCFVEDTALAWTVDKPVDRTALITMLVRSLHALVAASTSNPTMDPVHETRPNVS
ncbi:MAG: TetR/AcrR family transcriptional regulator [Micromonosporaceae bacterium]